MTAVTIYLYEASSPQTNLHASYVNYGLFFIFGNIFRESVN